MDCGESASRFRCFLQGQLDALADPAFVQITGNDRSTIMELVDKSMELCNTSLSDLASKIQDDVSVVQQLSLPGTSSAKPSVSMFIPQVSCSNDSFW